MAASGDPRRGTLGAWPMKSRPLTPGEIEMAQSIFGGAIDYSRVRLIDGKWWHQQPVLQHVTGLHLHDDRARFLYARHCIHGLVPRRVERLADRRDALDAIALEHGIEFARRGFDASEELGRGLVAAKLVADCSE